MVCTVDLQQACLLLYPLSEWQLIESKLLKLSNMNPHERRVQRVLLGNAMDCQVDKNGRILLSAPLRAHAGLNKKLMLVGQLNKFEIWDEDSWQQQMQADIAQEQQGDFELTERLQDFSF
jgi:MraZ protein